MLPRAPKQGTLGSRRSPCRAGVSSSKHGLPSAERFPGPYASSLLLVFAFVFLLGLSKGMADPRRRCWGPFGHAVGDRSRLQAASLFFYLLRSTESEDSAEEHAPSPPPGRTRALESSSVSSELYRSVSFLNLDIGL